MKPHDKRRLNAMIEEEEHGAATYEKMAHEMKSAGHHIHADYFMAMAKDEDKHARLLRRMKADDIKFKGVPTRSPHRR